MINLPQIPTDLDTTYNMCFGCGRDNPIGLKLSFQWDGKTARAEFFPREEHQGWQGYVHGGIVACLLDEAMAYAAHYSGVNCVTARMEVRLRQMVKVNEPLILTSSVSKQNRRLIETKATVSLRDGTAIAEGTSTLFIISARKEPLKNGKK